MDKILDRRIEFDERSKLYRATAGIEDRPFRSYTWKCDLYLDQGSEGRCVSYAWTHELAARPKVILKDEKFANDIYKRAQELDEWPGSDYSGTSVLAGIKAVQESLNSKGKPLITEYRWAFGIEDVLRVLGYKGPLVLGIWWYDSMYDPTDGVISLSGRKVGGHAILAKGIKIVKVNPSLPAWWANVDQDKSMVRLHNSWGKNYGIGGDGLISVRNLATLLDDEGEACVPVVRSGR